MTQLTKALNAWGTPAFEQILKNQIEQMDVEALPLQQGLSQGSFASGEDLGAMILGISERPDCIVANVGVFYSGIISGCNCADDPTPIDKSTEYCEIRFEINKSTAHTTLTLLPD